MSIRNFCFTINNPTDEDFQVLHNTECQYLIYGREKGENNTPHLQGYAELYKKTRFNTIKKYLPRAHIEQRHGTQQQAITYCMKEDPAPYIRGTPREQGCRTDLDAVRRCALEDGMRTVTGKYNLQQINVATKFLTYNEEPREWLTEVIWLWGQSGVGKSKLAREIANMNDCFVKNCGSKWWDGYDAHDDVIIDDFRDSWWSLTEMLSLLDRYEKRVEVKGGWRQFKPKRIIITSIFPPESMYAGTGEDKTQLLRRITEVRNLVPDVPEVAGVILNPAPQTDPEVEAILECLIMGGTSPSFPPATGLGASTGPGAPPLSSPRTHMHQETLNEKNEMEDDIEDNID